MTISYIVAAAQNGVIGKEGRLPWKLKEDLQFFKTKTWGHCVVMGRNTFESIGRPLPGRHNIILTSQKKVGEGYHIVQSPEQAIERAKSLSETELFVIGGAKIYESFLPWVQKIYLTEVEGNFEGDTYFKLPTYKNAQPGTWQTSENGIRYAFHEFEIR